jgi:hypothetical protein
MSLQLSQIPIITNGLYMKTIGMSEMKKTQTLLTLKMVHGTNSAMINFQNMVYSHSIGNIFMQDIEQDRTLEKLKGFYFNIDER